MYMTLPSPNNLLFVFSRAGHNRWQLLQEEDFSTKTTENTEWS